MDLLAQIDAVPKGDVVDLGCGNGAVGAALAQRFAGRNLIGVDAPLRCWARPQKRALMVR